MFNCSDWIISSSSKTVVPGPFWVMKNLPVVWGGSNNCKFHCNVQRFALYIQALFGLVMLLDLWSLSKQKKKTRNRKHRKSCFRDLQGNVFWHEKGREISMESCGYMPIPINQTYTPSWWKFSYSTKNCKNVSSKSLLSKIFPPSRGDSKRS